MARSPKCTFIYTMFSLSLFAFTILFIIGCATAQNRWKHANSLDTITGYEEFLRQYPQSDHATEAGARLEQLYFEEAKNKASVIGYKEFLGKYPKGKYSKEIDSRLRMFITEYLQNVKEISITPSQLDRNTDIKNILTDILLKKGYRITDTALDRITITYLEDKYFSGTSSSYWHPTISHMVVLTFTHNQYGKLYNNSYIKEVVDKDKVFRLHGELDLWGYGIKFMENGILPSSPSELTYARPTKENPDYQRYLEYDWNSLYSFDKFKIDLYNLLENKLPLYVYDDSEVLP